ncbi:hypothetical protein BJ165DRAFT_1501846 [Panaeolus papilionaceus]|nr:hypothetical protein BJ165DRAFT_1501846 [Panaeolus papilionaceus]
MTLTLKRMNNAAKRRAQFADPNHEHCLIENCSKTQAVEVAHVFSRESLTYMIDGLEWNWAMKKGALNLDTRQNIFFLGASMHELYKKNIWALLPEKDIVYQYLDCQGLRPLKRPQFPKIEGDTFQYKVLPLQDMEDMYITRQTTNGNGPRVAVYDHPFEDLPTITSHVHPKYVILHLGPVLRELPKPTRKALVQQIPWLKGVTDLFIWWTTRVPEFARDHLSYTHPPFNLSSGSSTSCSGLSDGELDTPPRRIQQLDTTGEKDSNAFYSAVTPSETHSGRTSELSNAGGKSVTGKRSAEEDLDDPEGRSKKRSLTCTSEALRSQDEREDLESVKWTSSRISRWARDFHSPTPIPSPSPPSQPPLSNINPPLRRSARLKAKMRKA